MKTLYQLFLSSTSEFAVERDRICSAVGNHFFVVTHEKREPEDLSPKEWCERELRESEVLIGLVGHRTGSLFEGKPIVQWEFELARELGVDRRIFMKPVEPDDALEGNQATFREQITEFEDGRFVRTYEHYSDFAEKLVSHVKDALLGWSLMRRQERRKRLEVPVARRVPLVLSAMLAFVLLGSTVAVSAGQAGDLGTDAVFAVLASVGATVLGAFLLTSFVLREGGDD